MKICHVITRMIVGGAQENTLLTMRGHLEKGHEVVLVTGPSPGREGELLAHTGKVGGRVEIVPHLVRELSPYHDLLAAHQLRKFFLREKFDVVHTHSSKAGIIGRWAARSAGVPVVVHTVHGQAFHPYQPEWRNRLYIALERWAARRCDRIYAVADAMIDQCVAAGVAPREKYLTVYSGMDTAGFASVRRDPELRSSLGIAPGARVIVTVARLFPLKGYEYVLPAAEKIIKEFPDTIILVVGDGPMHDQLAGDLRRRGISGNFRFAGLVAPDRVREYLAQGDLLWHLSLREGLPRSVVQALASGIPAIGFPLDGTPEVIIDGKTGFLAAVESVDDVVKATGVLWRDAEKRRVFGENGRRMVCEKFDWRRMADILEEEYLKIFSKRA